MSLTFGPRKVGIGVTSASQVSVKDRNGNDASLSDPVSVTPGSKVSFTVETPGRYYVTATSNYYSQTVTVDLAPDLPYGADLSSKVEYLLAGGGGGGGGAVQSVNGKIGHVTLTAADVNAKASSYTPTWTEVSGKPTTFTPSTHGHTASQVSDLSEAVQDIIGSTIQAGSNITVTYNDSEGTFTIASTASGGGGGAVDSVNGETGVVVLSAADVGALPDTWQPDLSGYATTSALTSGLDGKVDDAELANYATTSSLTIGLAEKLDVPSGTASGTTYARGDGTWASVDWTDVQNRPTSFTPDLAGVTAEDVGAATAQQGDLADSAVQPEDLASVATSGAYSDLSGTPEERIILVGNATEGIGLAGLYTTRSGAEADGAAENWPVGTQVYVAEEGWGA